MSKRDFLAFLREVIAQIEADDSSGGKIYYSKELDGDYSFRATIRTNGANTQGVAVVFDRWAQADQHVVPWTSEPDWTNEPSL